MLGIIAAKGQGATEYLLLLAIVLVVAMVAIALLGYFPGMSSDAKLAESDAYWQGDARPFGILEHSLDQNGTLYLIVQNMDTEQKNIDSIFAEGSSFFGVSGPRGTSAWLSGGEKKTYRVKLWDGACMAGNVYELNVNITYANAQGDIIKTQFGNKKLAGRCSMDVASTASGAEACPNDDMVCGRTCVCDGSSCDEAALCGQDAQAVHCECGQHCMIGPAGLTCG
jgi:hypothetical protein